MTEPDAATTAVERVLTDWHIIADRAVIARDVVAAVRPLIAAEARANALAPFRRLAEALLADPNQDWGGAVVRAIGEQINDLLNGDTDDQTA